jgi:hypothetical protein
MGTTDKQVVTDGTGAEQWLRDKGHLPTEAPQESPSDLRKRLDAHLEAGGDSRTFEIKDSGEREVMPTGSQRDSRVGKGRYDLIPYDPLRRLALVYEKGAEKYDDNNWRKGQPLRRYIDSAMRHLQEAARGSEDEDHIMQAAWNCFAFCYTQAQIRAGNLPPELDDLLQDERS